MILFQELTEAVHKNREILCTLAQLIAADILLSNNGTISTKR